LSWQKAADQEFLGAFEPLIAKSRGWEASMSAMKLQIEVAPRIPSAHWHCAGR
jgi:hypothetical protein